MVFDELFPVNVNEFTEKKKVDEKTELTYLSWSYAWAEVMKRFPETTYEIERFEDHKPYLYDPLTGYMVFTKVTIEGITREMWLPVMDGKNRAMKAEPYTYTVKRYGKPYEQTVQAATMTDINKTIMRCLVKNLAMFGLGLYIYAGEDLPITDEEKPADKTDEKVEESPKQNAQNAYPSRDEMVARLTKSIKPVIIKKWFDNWGVESFEQVRDEALMGMFRYYENRGAFA